MADVNIQTSPNATFLDDLRSRFTLRGLLIQLRAFIALILLVTFFAAISEPFTKESNQIILAKQVAINAILGIGTRVLVIFDDVTMCNDTIDACKKLCTLYLSMLLCI